MSKKLIMQPLSNEKIMSALGPDTKILKYSDLRQYNSINDILPKINSFVILLLEDEPAHGHWTCMIRTAESKYYYFNSYGQKYDSDLSVIPMCIRSILGEDRREITRLLDGKDCDWNHNKFQGERSQVCGRFCILACSMIGMMGYSPTDFEKFLKKQKKQSDKSYDQLVAGFVKI